METMGRDENLQKSPIVRRDWEGLWETQEGPKKGPGEREKRRRKRGSTYHHSSLADPERVKSLPGQRAAKKETGVIPYYM